MSGYCEGCGNTGWCSCDEASGYKNTPDDDVIEQLKQQLADAQAEIAHLINQREWLAKSLVVQLYPRIETKYSPKITKEREQEIINQAIEATRKED